MKHLFRTTALAAPFSSVIAYVSDFFEAHPDLRVKALASPGIPVETQSEIVEDSADTVRRHEAVTLSWQPRWSIFPTFHGRATVRPQSPGSVLAIEGSYEPPGGRIGILFDRIIGEKLAYRTVDDLLGRLRRYVESRHRDFQLTCPSLEELNESDALSTSQSRAASNDARYHPPSAPTGKKHL